MGVGGVFPTPPTMSATTMPIGSTITNVITGPRRVHWVGKEIAVMREGRRYLCRVTSLRQERYATASGRRETRCVCEVEILQN